MNRYIVRRRARFLGIGGRQVNLPYGTVLSADAGFILYDGTPLCAETSKNAHDYFSQDNDGHGAERGALVATILKRLNGRQDRWDRVWEDSVCQQYRRPEHPDHWLWSHAFYTAPIADLEHIAEVTT